MQGTRDPQRTNVGLIGVGLMGHGIAKNIARAGFPLSVLEHPGNQPLADLKAAGVSSTADVLQMAADVDVLILCVTGTPQVESIVLGEKGVLRTLRHNAVVVDCSTSNPTSTEKIAKAVQEAGGRFLDAAMTRTPKEADEGRLNLLVGGDPELFEELRPLLSSFSENITHAGPTGAGHRMKLLHNYVSLGSVALLAEAAACARRAGLDPEIFVDVLAKGGGAGAALNRLAPYLVARDASGLRFAMSNAEKDLSYYVAMVREGASAGVIAEAVLKTFEAASRTSPDAFVPSLVDFLSADQSQSQPA